METGLVHKNGGTPPHFLISFVEGEVEKKKEEEGGNV